MDVFLSTLSRSSVCDRGPGTSRTCSSVRSHALLCVAVDQARLGRVQAYALTFLCVLQWTRHVTDVFRSTLSRSSVCDIGPGTSRTCSGVRSHALLCVTVDQACHGRVPAYALTPRSSVCDMSKQHGSPLNITFKRKCYIVLPNGLSLEHKV